MLGRAMRIKTGSGATGLKSSCTATRVACPKSHLSSADANHSLALRMANARSTRVGTPEVG
eukprot:2951365-Lingulodinium_polyedra.AAC.1